ncbi:MAG: PaaI family thioesterase [Proteobacteria bacterium]|nr:PaaI family thioesterase [Pseudomonadota bacterium]
MSSEATPEPLLTVEAVSRLIDETFPEIHSAGRRMVIESVGPSRAQVRLASDPRNLRPGGTISGPAMFTLADFAIYVALLATLGRPAIPAVTSNLNITFLVRPEPGDVVADVRLIRIGRRLAYAEVTLTSNGAGDPIAHATGTYALGSSKAASRPA